MLSSPVLRTLILCLSFFFFHAVFLLFLFAFVLRIFPHSGSFLRLLSLTIFSLSFDLTCAHFIIFFTHWSDSLVLAPPSFLFLLFSLFIGSCLLHTLIDGVSAACSVHILRASPWHLPRSSPLNSRYVPIYVDLLHFAPGLAGCFLPSGCISLGCTFLPSGTLSPVCASVFPRLSLSVSHG